MWHFSDFLNLVIKKTKAPRYTDPCSRQRLVAMIDIKPLFS